MRVKLTGIPYTRANTLPLPTRTHQGTGSTREAGPLAMFVQGYMAHLFRGKTFKSVQEKAGRRVGSNIGALNILDI